MSDQPNFQQQYVSAQHLHGLQATFLEHQLFGNRIVAFIPASRYYAYAVQLQNSRHLERAISLADRVALKCGVDRVRVSRYRGVIIYQIGLPETMWSTTLINTLSGPAIGVDAMQRTVDFTFDEPHALVAGVTGSGKSETLRSIVYALIRSACPDQLKLILIDPHSELAPFDNILHLAGPIARTPAAIRAALTFVYDTFRHRRANNVRDDVRLVLVIDESNLALAEPACMRMAEALAQESRKFKINLIIGAGRITRAELGLLPTSLSNKFVGYVPTARDSAFLAGPGLQCHRLTGKGDFLHIAPHKTERFQVALTTPADLASLERGEIKPFTVPDSAAQVPLDEVEPRSAGRPRQSIRPETIADYLIAQNKLSIPQAEALFGLKRTGHNLHKRFTARLLIRLNQAGWQLTKKENIE